MVNPSDPITAQTTIGQVRAAAARLGITVDPIEAKQPDQIERAFSSTQDGVHGVMVQADGMFFRERRRIAELGLKRKVPTSVFNPIMVEEGGLLTYAPSTLPIFRRSAAYIDKIIKGANPGELPVELPTKFEFAINLKTAKAIGLTISPSILNLADKVIE